MNKKVRNIVVMAAIAAAMVLGFYFLSYQGKIAQIKELDVAIAELDEKIQTAEEHKQRIVQLSQEIEDLELSLKYAREKLPSTEELTKIVEDVYKLGTMESNISIESFIPGNQVPREIYSEKPYTMKIIGSFHQIATFFNKIGNLNRILNIDNLSMSLGKNDFELATFTLTTYIYNESKGPAKKPAAPGKGGAK